VRTSFSTIVGDSRDFACVLLNHEAKSICQSSFSPPDFCVILPRTTRSMLQKFPVETLREGDVLFTNDAWLGAGHLPDCVVVTPVFWQGKLVAFMGTIAHVSDVGGHRGDIDAYDVFTEGLRMPPCKLYMAGVENEQAFAIIEANCRVPEMVLGDLRAIVGTHQIGSRRMKEFLADYGTPDIEALSHEIHTRSEALMRERIAALPDGKYEFGLDIDGYIDIVHLHATVEVRGSEIYVDYTGTSPQTRKGAINCVYNVTYSSTMYPFKCALAPRIPNNDGLFRPIHVSVPEGCILNTTFPHPVKARAKVTNNINQVVFGAVWPIFGEHAQAGSGSIWPFSVTGQFEEYGNFAVFILPHGGRGAMRNLDGLIPIAFPHNSAVTATEIMEVQAPILMLCKEFLPDSAGPGRQRGGISQMIKFRSIADGPMSGIDGGKPGRVGTVHINGELITRFPPIEFHPGDLVELRMPGGAGFGPVAERDPKLVLADLALGYITAEGAHRDYGVDIAALAQG
jgi:N-methylhydantoinase B